MACINKNLKEFKDLAISFPSEKTAYALAIMWQKINDTDRIPTYNEVKEMQKQEKKKGNKKKKVLKEKLMTNLQSLGFVNNINGSYFLNVTSKDSYSSISNKINKIYNFLSWNNIPPSFIKINSKNFNSEIKFDNKSISNFDPVLNKKDFNEGKIRKILDYLLPKLPGIKYQMVSASDAKVLYDAIPNELKDDVDFKDVKSFFNPVNREVVIIDSRVTDEIAIEEILHPFVAALNLENKELFNKLLKDAKENQSSLYEQLKSYYKEEDIEEELVTKTMVKYFKKEFDKSPKSSFVKSIKEALNWFLDKIKDMYSKLTGKTLAVKSIDKDSNFTDIAKLLNTDDLVFEYNLPEKMRVKYALSKNKENVIKNALYNGTDQQRFVIESLFKNVRKASKEYDQFTASKQDKEESDNINNRIVILEEGVHEYTNKLNENENFTSVTSTFNSFEDKENEYEFNRGMGNIFDSILEAQILGLKDDALYENLKNNEFVPLELLGENEQEQKQQINEINISLQAAVATLTSDGDILIPQVIVHNIAVDKENYQNIAGAIDLLAVTPEGKLKIIDLKTSRDSVRSGKYKTPFSIKGTLLNEASKKLGIREQETLTKEQKHTLQLAMYSAMLENMGYELDHEQPYFTINFKIDVKGERADQKYKKKFYYEGINARSVKVKGQEISQFTSSIQEVLASYLIEKRKNTKETTEYVQDESTESDLQETALSPEVVEGKLSKYRDILLKRKDAIEQMKNKIFLDRKPVLYIQKIEMVISMISAAIDSNSIAEANKAYAEVLSNAVRETDKFIDYLKEPSNQIDPNFIVYVQNAKEFSDQFKGLYVLRDNENINSSISKLVSSLQSKLNTLVENDGKNLSIANEALYDFVRTQINEISTQEFTEEELDVIMRQGTDIGLQELWFRDMATSRDALLRVMNKIFHNTQMNILDEIKKRESTIRAKSRKLLLLSNTKNPEEIYDFMLYEDGTYVQKYSKEFLKLRKEKRMTLFDENGNWKEYIEIKNEVDATKEQIQYNIDLFEAKKEYAEFMRAEEISADGTVTSGMHYEYTDDYIKDREKFEELRVSKNGYGYWVRKDNISNRIYDSYERKYYGRRDYRTIVSENGIPTAQTVEKENVRYVKNKFKKIKDEDSKGKSLLDERYEKIHKPTNELERAQLEFYEMFVSVWQNLLDKLPPGERRKMIGRIPSIRNKFATEASRKPAGVLLIWTKLLDTLKSIKAFFENTTQLRAVTTNEFGDPVDSIPIFYTGNLKDEEELKNIEDKLEALKEKRKNKEISFDQFNKELSVLKGKRKVIESRPSKNELSRDLGSSLLEFSIMAENYEKMSEAENTFNAFLSVIENKTYQPGGVFKTGEYKGNEFIEKPSKPGKDSNVYKRAQAFMNMVVYDKDKIPKNAFDKVATGLMKWTSLSYVGLNPFGSFNNYLFGKLSNYNEAFGGRFFSTKAYFWSEREYKSKGIKGWLNRLSSVKDRSIYEDVLDSDMILDPDPYKKTMYDPTNPLNKFEAMVDFWRMEDSKGDLREASFEFGKNTFKEKVINGSYILQDKGEHINQTKIGMAILKDFIIQDAKGLMPEISLYDAYVFDPNKSSDVRRRGLTLKKGYEDSVIIKAPGQFKIRDKDGQLVLLSSEVRYNIRSYIREVNKQIHGNYADKDRMLIQQYTIGKLFAQFHKWVAPAFHSRFQKEYYDENLGWMEGRYMSFLKMINYMKKNASNISTDINKFKEDYIEFQGEKRAGNVTDAQWTQMQQKFENRLKGFKRTSAELVLIGLIMTVNGLIQSLRDDDDDDEKALGERVAYSIPQPNDYKDELGTFWKRLANYGTYQADRIEKEFTIYLPIPSGIKQLMDMADSPVASTRVMGELSEALSYTVWLPYGWLTQTEEEFWKNKEYVYQRKPRKGELKFTKNWGDVVIVAYAINKWKSFETLTNFKIN